ncbi:pyrroline-5-carboxylate reductase [Oscillospiraceae bacterium OttesenSCG-928-G22]|nr:pyrroline-5-carboxylate reductase [Oscillospiraceae bacterium OttesenSCG-928-G22]
MASLRLGIIGYGNMARAILESVLLNEQFAPSDIILYDTDPAKLQSRPSPEILAAESLRDLMRFSDLILLSIKPQVFPAVLPELKPYSAGKCFLTIAAGISTGYIKEHVGANTHVVRVMPNTPILYGKGATAIAKTDSVPHEYYKLAVSIFQSAGEIAFIDESQMNEITGVNGSSPAYYFLLVDAICKAAEEQGIESAAALRLAAKTMEGAAVMLLESGRSPAELAADVTSPGGTTLAALTAMEKLGFTNAVREGMLACTKRAYELGK